MNYLWTTINVDDLEAMVAFYRDVVGLDVVTELNNPDGTNIAFMGNGETQVELIRHGDGSCEEIGKGISLGFEVADVNQKMEEVKAKGFPVVAGPFSPVPTIIFFYVEDPMGVRVQFVENR